MGSKTWNPDPSRSASTQAWRFGARTTIVRESRPSSPPYEPVTSRAGMPRAVSIIAAADAKYSQWPALERSRKCTSGAGPVQRGVERIHEAPGEMLRDAPRDRPRLRETGREREGVGLDLHGDVGRRDRAAARAARRHPADLRAVPHRAAGGRDLHHAVRQLDGASPLHLDRRGPVGQEEEPLSEHVQVHGDQGGPARARLRHRRRVRGPVAPPRADARLARPDAVEVVRENGLAQAQRVLGRELAVRRQAQDDAVAPLGGAERREVHAIRRERLAERVLHAEGREREGAVQAREREEERHGAERAAEDGDGRQAARGHRGEHPVRRRLVEVGEHGEQPQRAETDPRRGREVQRRRDVRRGRRRGQRQQEDDEQGQPRLARPLQGRELREAGEEEQVDDRRAAAPAGRCRGRVAEPREVREPGHVHRRVRDAHGAAPARPPPEERQAELEEQVASRLAPPVHASGKGARNAAGASTSR